jgi:intein/homing endonuclease
MPAACSCSGTVPSIGTKKTKTMIFTICLITFFVAFFIGYFKGKRDQRKEQHKIKMLHLDTLEQVLYNYVNCTDNLLLYPNNLTSRKKSLLLREIAIKMISKPNKKKI